MGFRLVPKSMTLNDLELRNGRVVCVISPNLLSVGAYYVKVVKIHQYIMGVKCSLKNLVLTIYHFWPYSQRITPSEGIKVKRPPTLAKI